MKAVGLVLHFSFINEAGVPIKGGLERQNIIYFLPVQPKGKELLFGYEYLSFATHA